MLLGLAYTVTAVPKYTATTNILIDSQKDQNALSASIAELTFDTGAIDSQVEVMKSEKIALAVISTMKLAQDPEFMGARGTLIGQAFGALRVVFDFSGWFLSREKSGAETDADLARAAMSQIKANLDVRRVARTYVLAIDYTSPDRGKAAAIANAFAEAYLTGQLDSKFEATRRAAGWLQSRIADLKQQSLAADFAIQKFKADKGIVVTGGDKPGLMTDQQLTDLNEQLGLARADTAKAEARYQQIEDLLKSGRAGASVPDSLANPVITDLREKFLAASKMEAQLESKLGAGHLQVISLRREMDEYQRLIYEELQRIAESYRSDAEVARQKEQSLTLVDVRSGRRERRHQPDHGAIARTGARIRNLQEPLSDLHAALSGSDSTAVVSRQRGAGDHRGDAAAARQLSQAQPHPRLVVGHGGDGRRRSRRAGANIATACFARLAGSR